jgi:GNAT superfamily N-acetyltransferase
MESRPEKSPRPNREPSARHFPRVREARQADLEAMVELLGYLFKQEAEFAPAPAKQRRALSLILAQPSAGRLLVLTLGGKVLGMVSLLFTISTAEGGKCAWLEDLVVRPDQRGRGHGTRLLRAALDWARRQGITRITLLTDSDNAGARALYLRQGFSSSAMQPLRIHLTRKSGVRPAILTMA